MRRIAQVANHGFFELVERMLAFGDFADIGTAQAAHAECDRGTQAGIHDDGQILGRTDQKTDDHTEHGQCTVKTINDEIAAHNIVGAGNAY